MLILLYASVCSDRYTWQRGLQHDHVLSRQGKVSPDFYLLLFKHWIVLLLYRNILYSVIKVQGHFNKRDNSHWHQRQLDFQIEVNFCHTLPCNVCWKCVLYNYTLDFFWKIMITQTNFVRVHSWMMNLKHLLNLIFPNCTYNSYFVSIELCVIWSDEGRVHRRKDDPRQINCVWNASDTKVCHSQWQRSSVPVQLTS